MNPDQRVTPIEYIGDGLSDVPSDLANRLSLRLFYPAANLPFPTGVPLGGIEGVNEIRGFWDSAYEGFVGRYRLAEDPEQRDDLHVLFDETYPPQSLVDNLLLELGLTTAMVDTPGRKPSTSKPYSFADREFDQIYFTLRELNKHGVVTADTFPTQNTDLLGRFAKERSSWTADLTPKNILNTMRRIDRTATQAIWNPGDESINKVDLIKTTHFFLACDAFNRR